jgi:beta-xylosidase
MKIETRIPKRLLALLSAIILICLTSVKAEAGKKIPLADPFIYYENGVYYAYGTGSDYGIPMYTSSDLKTWHYDGLALNKNNTNIPRFFWAPEVYKVGQKYIMYFSGNEHLYVAEANSPKGPFKQVGNAPMLQEKAIDSSIFYSLSGKPYIVFVRMNDGNNVWVAPLREDMYNIDTTSMKHCFSVSQEWEKAQARVNEGPCVFTRHKKYYMIYSANDFRSPFYGLGMAESLLPEGPWTKWEDNPFLQKPDTLVGVGHNSFFKDAKGRMRIVFHAHASAHRVQPRYMYIGTLKFYRRGGKEHVKVVDIIQPTTE